MILKLFYQNEEHFPLKDCFETSKQNNNNNHKKKNKPKYTLLKVTNLKQAFDRLELQMSDQLSWCCKRVSALWIWGDTYSLLDVSRLFSLVENPDQKTQNGAT